METVARGSSELSEIVTDDHELPLSVHAVMSNDDLLIEILLKLPVISLLLFKSVSKRWLSLVTSPAFIMHRSQIPNMDRPSCLFIMDPFETDRFDFVRLDDRIPSGTSRFKTIFKSRCSNGFVNQSCNGLLLCSLGTDKYCVYNPSINLFKMLPQRPHNSRPGDISCGMKMAFNPHKSPHYKVVYASVGLSIQIQTYSSETRNWRSSVCSNRFPAECFSGFDDVIYWNDAIHWLILSEREALHYKLDIVNEVPALTNIRLPLLLDGRLFESRGCLLLLGMDYTHSHQLNIYEMSSGCLEWSFKCVVNLGHIIVQILGKWTICSRIWCIVLGEQKEDSFMVIKLNKMVVQYKIVSKTCRGLCQASLFSPIGSFLFTASFANV